MHPNSTVSVYPLERLTKLYDGIEQLEDDGWAGDTSDGEESVGEENGEGVWLKDDEGVWRYRLEEADGNEWEETDEDEDGNEGDENDAMNVDDDFGTDFMTVSSHPDTPPPPLEPVSTVAPSPTIQMSSNDAEDPILNSNIVQESNATADSSWKRFDILTSAPSDHAFYAAAPAQPSKSFLGRLNKEYRVLLSSLPGVYMSYFFAHSGD